MPLQIRRGTSAERLTITPLPGELLYDTTTEQIFIGDGATLGGRITTGISIEDSIDASAELFTSGVHTGIIFNFDDSNNRMNASIIGPFVGELVGNAEGDLKGSVFADDSSILVDAVSGQLVGPLATSGLANNLNLNGFAITSNVNSNVLINPQGTGNTVFSNNLSITSAGNITKTGPLNISPSGLFSIGSNISLVDGNFLITRNSYTTGLSAGFTFAQHHSNPDAVNFTFYRTRGTGVSPEAVQINDELGEIAFVGTGSTGVAALGAVITVTADGTSSASNIPTKFGFATNNGIDTSYRAELSSNGVWKVDTIQGLTDTLSITGNLSGDVKGSIYSDDSTRILDGTSGRITTPSVTLAEFLKLPVYADDTARDTTIPSPEKGMVIFIEAGTLPAATNQMQVHNGTSWVSL
jgi:hypothetical protein